MTVATSSQAEFPILQVDAEEERTEPIGSKTKAWFRREGNLWLFKHARPEPGEDWAEKIAAEIADRLGLPHALVELAQYQGKPGILTSDFTEGQRRGNLVDGNELLFASDPEYPKERQFRVPQHTLAAVRHALDDSGVVLPDWPWPTGVTTPWEGFIGYIMLDASSATLIDIIRIGAFSFGVTIPDSKESLRRPSTTPPAWAVSSPTSSGCFACATFKTRPIPKPLRCALRGTRSSAIALRIWLASSTMSLLSQPRCSLPLNDSIRHPRRFSTACNAIFACDREGTFIPTDMGATNRYRPTRLDYPPGCSEPRSHSRLLAVQGGTECGRQAAPGCE